VLESRIPDAALASPEHKEALAELVPEDGTLYRPSGAEVYVYGKFLALPETTVIDRDLRAVHRKNKSCL
jgi:hypothetical protein